MAIGYMNYKITYDYHTHTVYSHGKGSIEDNVRVAEQKGLKGVAISDHGPGHLLYGIHTGKIKKMRDEIERLRGIYKNIEIFLSVEANILNKGNGLDINDGEFKDYDFLTAGYHYGIRHGSCVQNFIRSISPIKLPGHGKRRRGNTDMIVKAIYENPIKILTHPGDKGAFDITEIAKACAARGTYMEINNHHEHLNREEIRMAAKTDVEFVVSSDAHSADKVGSCDVSIKKAMEAGLDMSRIVNIVEY